MKKEIPITCEGTQYMPINQLENFQENLKELKEVNYNKLKKVIEKYGFSFPVFVWNNKIIDGHQRIFVIKKMMEEGYTIGDIPVVNIQARNEREAKEKILLAIAEYGTVTDEGLYEFIEKSSDKLYAKKPMATIVTETKLPAPPARSSNAIL